MSVGLIWLIVLLKLSRLFLLSACSINYTEQGTGVSYQDCVSASPLVPPDFVACILKLLLVNKLLRLTSLLLQNVPRYTTEIRIHHKTVVWSLVLGELMMQPQIRGKHGHRWIEPGLRPTSLSLEPSLLNIIYLISIVLLLAPDRDGRWTLGKSKGPA